MTSDLLVEDIVADIKTELQFYRIGASSRSVDNFTGPAGEIIQYEVVVNSEHNPITYPSGIDYLFMRVGDVIFLDDKMKPKLSSSLLETSAGHITYLSSFDNSALANILLRRYSALAAYALDCVDVGSHVLDLGSADGILSLIAYSKGASVTAVDEDSKMERLLLSHVGANGYDSSQFQFLAEDVRALDISAIEKPVTTVVANLGPHYGSSDLAAIDTIRLLPNVTTFIGGGYVKPVSLFHPSRRYNPSRAIEFLQELDFHSFEFVHEDDSSGCPRTAFIARRHL